MTLDEHIQTNQAHTRVLHQLRKLAMVTWGNRGDVQPFIDLGE